jgi:hypothetical protein
VSSAAPVYFHLCALGLSLRLVDNPEHPDGYAVKVRNLDHLDPLARERARDRIRDHRAQLGAMLSSCSTSAAAMR